MPSGRFGRKLGRVNKKFGILKKIKKHGPRVGAVALALGTLAVGAYASSQGRPGGGTYSENPMPHPSVGTIEQQKLAMQRDDATWAREETMRNPPSKPHSMFEAAQVEEQAHANFFEMRKPLEWRKGRVMHESRGKAGIDY